VVMFSSAALILSIPNLSAVVAAQSGDVVSDTLTAHLGAGITKPLLAMFVIGFVSSFLAVQAAVSRCIWGAARDRSLPGSNVLGRLAGQERLPVYAIALTAVAGVSVRNVIVDAARTCEAPVDGLNRARLQSSTSSLVFSFSDSNPAFIRRSAIQEQHIWSSSRNSPRVPAPMTAILEWCSIRYDERNS